ncbi:MAG: hypothetical protein IKL10_04695 [Clostridia bacterium]|nr:hypothetical protein [Clostridia bacterium]
MSDRDIARRASAEIIFDGADISKSVLPYLLSLTYTDNEEDETDDLQIKMHDRDDIWLQEWLQKAISADSVEPQVSLAQDTASSGELVAGTALYLDKVKGYVSSTTSYSFGKKTGTFYTWDNKVIRGRRRITNLRERVGVPGQVTCWINAEDAYPVSSDGANEHKTVIKSSGLTIGAVIAQTNFDDEGSDRTLDCGLFELDSVDASGPPSVITIKATSLPFTTQIRQTKKYKAWESYNLSGIAKEMAECNGMTCMFLAGEDPHYDRVEQFNVSDINFLSTLCHNAGISLKVSNNIIVLFNQSEYEQKTEIKTIKRGDGSYLKWKLNTAKADSKYTSCRVRYITSSGQLIEGISRVEDYDADSKTNQQLEIRAKVSSISEAQELAKKLLRLHNKYGKKASFTLSGDTRLHAGLTVMLQDFGAWNGKYIISQAKHQLGSSGYNTQINLRKVLEGY